MNPVLLQAEGGAFGMQLVLFAVIFGIFYFIVFRPMRKRQRDTEQMLKSLERGTRVITSGGLHGTITGLSDDLVTLKVTDTVKLRVSRSAISSVISPEGPAGAKPAGK